MNDIAQTILGALDERRQVEPFSTADPSFDLDAAYAASDSVVTARIGRGQTPVGWKIGFTNRTIWDEYDVHAPIWGPMYDTTVRQWDPADLPAAIDTESFIEPRIEPEIVFRIARPPRSVMDMDDRELLSCLDAVGHGFEIVQSIYRGWRFAAADTVAACALHGALVHGPLTAIDPSDASEWLKRLATFEIDLYCDGGLVDHGIAANVLDGPLSALRHFLAGIERRPMIRDVQPGDLVTTGTLTRAFPVSAGEIWSTRLNGLDLPGMRVWFGGGEATIEHLVAKAAQARFHVEHPETCATPGVYEQAVTTGIAAETAIARLLFRDQSRLAKVRNEIAKRALSLEQGLKNRPAS